MKEDPSSVPLELVDEEEEAVTSKQSTTTSSRASQREVFSHRERPGRVQGLNPRTFRTRTDILKVPTRTIYQFATQGVSPLPRYVRRRWLARSCHRSFSGRSLTSSVLSPVVFMLNCTGLFVLCLYLPCLLPSEPHFSLLPHYSLKEHSTNLALYSCNIRILHAT